MPDRMVFDKIQQYLNTIDANSNGTITKHELNAAKDKIPSVWMQKISDIAGNQDVSKDKIIMGLGVEHTEDNDEEHTVSGDKKYRFRSGTDSENYARALEDAKFFIERNVEKWFSIDINADGKSSNIEEQRWGRHNTDASMNDGDLNETKSTD